MCGFCAPVAVQRRLEIGEGFILRLDARQRGIAKGRVEAVLFHPSRPLSQLRFVDGLLVVADRPDEALRRAINGPGLLHLMAVGSGRADALINVVMLRLWIPTVIVLNVIWAE